MKKRWIPLLSALALSAHAEIAVTHSVHGITDSKTSDADGRIVQTAEFSLNGGNAVALLVTAEGAGARISASFAGQDMESVSTNEGDQSASIFYLINPDVQEGAFTIMGPADSKVTYAYSQMALNGVADITKKSTATSKENRGALKLEYTVNRDGGAVLTAAANNGYGTSRPAPKISPAHATEWLLEPTVVETSGHCHAYGTIESQGTFEETFTNLFQRTAVCLLAFEPMPEKVENPTPASASAAVTLLSQEPMPEKVKNPTPEPEPETDPETEPQAEKVETPAPAAAVDATPEDAPEAEKAQSPAAEVAEEPAPDEEPKLKRRKHVNPRLR